MVESGSLPPTGYVTAGATTASHPLRFQPRPMSPLQPASEGSAHRGDCMREQASPGHAQREAPRRLLKASGASHQGGRHHPGCSRGATVSRSGKSRPAHCGRATSPTSGAAERFPRPETLTGRP